jgi:hypothetical protein
VVDSEALANVFCECWDFAFSVQLRRQTTPKTEVSSRSLPPCSRLSQHNFAVRDQLVYTANDLKVLYELCYLTRMKSLVVQKVGVTQSGSLVDTWVCMCVGHVRSGSFYEVIVLSSVRPRIGQHWRVTAVCWRAHNVTRNSSCPTAMQHGVCSSRLLIAVFTTAASCQHCIQNCPVLSTLCSELARPVNTVFRTAPSCQHWSIARYTILIIAVKYTLMFVWIIVYSIYISFPVLLVPWLFVYCLNLVLNCSYCWVKRVLDALVYWCTDALMYLIVLILHNCSFTNKTTKQMHTQF